jgi:hypothetical protein
MPYLTNAQRKLLAPAGEEHPERGAMVPTSDGLQQAQVDMLNNVV